MSRRAGMSLVALVFLIVLELGCALTSRPASFPPARALLQAAMEPFPAQSVAISPSNPPLKSTRTMQTIPLQDLCAEYTTNGRFVCELTPLKAGVSSYNAVRCLESFCLHRHSWWGLFCCLEARCSVPCKTSLFKVLALQPDQSVGHVKKQAPHALKTRSSSFTGFLLSLEGRSFFD
jgi:hypothetical protein